MKAVNLCASAILERKCYMKNVKVLSVLPFTEGEFQKKRVAAYFRISTEFEEQHRSLAAQMEYYKEKIQSNPDWVLVY